MATSPTDRTRVRRAHERGVYDRKVIDEILDEARVCHLGFVHDSQPFVVPTAHARDRDVLYLHGSTASRALRQAVGQPVCVTVTLLDGLVLARSGFHHSMNYRSVLVLGTATEITSVEEKEAALDVLVDAMVAGRAADIRRPTAAELRATRVLAVPLDEASAKIRTGPPIDDPADLDAATWGGVVPMRTVALPPSPDDHVPAGMPPPAYLHDLGEPSGLLEPPGPRRDRADGGGPVRCFEDFAVGQVLDLGSLTVHRDEIVRFAARYDPQPFHLDDDAARVGPFGQLTASGWLTASLFMRLYATAVLHDSASMGGPGVEALRWRAPVAPDTTLTGTLEVVDIAPSGHRDDRGSVFFHGWLDDQDGRTVMTLDFRGYFRRRTPRN